MNQSQEDNMLRCLTLTAERDEQKRENIRRYSGFIDCVEIRLDLCESKTPETVRSLIAAADCPVVLSCRRKRDTAAGAPDPGAEILPDNPADEKQRLAILAEVLQPGISFVDLEADADSPDLLRKAEALNVRIIRSVHDFQGVPSDLAGLVKNLAAQGAIPKIACFPRSSGEALDLYRSCRKVEDVREKIVLGMGPFGFFTRVAPWLCGSMLTFISAGDRKGAPGHIGPRELEEVYGLSGHGCETRIFGIIGNPVMHTLSPRLHNPWFSSGGMNAVYVPFQVDDLAQFFRMAEEIGVLGFSVTVPHKQGIIDMVDEISDDVRDIGACNTVVRREKGWFGSNTDLAGFLDPLEDVLEAERIDRALVIGAGGAARTVVYALKRRGLEITVVNRSPERARALAESAGTGWFASKTLPSLMEFELVVQTTSAGMEPDIEADPLPDFIFQGTEIVYDIIYAPEKTRFLQRAEAAGCRIIGGSRMLRAQAELQFEQFRNSYNLWAE